MTSLDMILSSAGISASDMDSQVSQYRKMSRDMELVLADHFSVEDLAAGVEQLAYRLQFILALTEGLLERDDRAGSLARDVHVIALADITGAGEILRRHLGLAATDDDGLAPIFGDVPLYGYPDLRCVTHTILYLPRPKFERHSYLVNLSTGDVTPVPEDWTAVETAERLFGKPVTDHA